MRIALDTTYMTTDSRNRGIGRYTNDLIEALNNSNSNHKFYTCDYEPSRFIKDYNIDIFHVTSPFDLPAHMRNREYYGDVKLVATIYDFIPLVFKELFLYADWKVEDYISKLKLVTECDRFMAISNHTKMDAIDFGIATEDKIDVVYGGFNTKFKKDNSSIFSGNPYILSVAGIDPHKNLEATINAFCRANKELDNKYNLVLVSSNMPSGVEQDCKNILGDKLTVFRGLSDVDLLYLYSHADMFVFASLYEGLGLPPLEALSCEVPLVISNTSSMTEIATDNFAVFVNPHDIDDIARGIIESSLKTEEEKRRESLLAKEYIKKFNWKDVAERTIESYEKVMNND